MTTRPYLTTFLVLACFGVVGVTAAQWQPLERDRLHDPDNPAVDVLQDPGEALRRLQPDSAGNRVDWVASLRRGMIQPRASLDGDRSGESLDSDVLMTNTLPARYVKFPHLAHTEWMSCENCHDGLFVAEADANPINMGRILEGEYCGVCHGAVAFPLTECDRCHNTDSSTVADGAAEPRGQP